MSNVEVDKYKLVLSESLAIYLSSILVFHLDKDQSLKFLSDAFETWSKGISKQVEEIIQNKIQQIMQTATDPEDVVNIVTRVHTIVNEEIKSEFILEMLEGIQKTIIDKK